MRAAGLGDAPPLGGGGGLGGRAGRDRAADGRGARRASCPTTTRPSSRSTCAPPRAPASRRPAHRRAHRPRGAQAARRGATLVTIGDNDQRAPNLANIYVKLIDPTERAAETRTRADGARAPGGRWRKQPPDLRADVSLVPIMSAAAWPRPLISTTCPGPDLEAARGVRASSRWRRCKQDPRRGRRRHHAGRRQARAGGDDRPRAGRRPGRAGGGRGRRAAAARRRR